MVPDTLHLAQRVYRLTKRRTFSSRVLDLGVIAGAWLLAYLASFNGAIPFGFREVMPYIGLAVAVQLITNQLAGLYGPIWKYASLDEAVRVMVAVSLGSTITGVLLSIVSSDQQPGFRSVGAPPIAALLMLLGIGGIRFQARLFAIERRQHADHADSMRALFVSTDDEGVSLAIELNRRSPSDILLVGLVTSDPKMVGGLVGGVRVVGTIDALESICLRDNIECILVATPHGSREHVQAIVDRALRTKARVKVLPPRAEILEGPLLRSLRDLDVTDLLGREHAPVDLSEIAAYLEDSRVLVTGAGGSIGSEIARQVAQFGPSRLLLLDHDESLLYDAMATVDNDRAEPVLADIRDDARMRNVFAQHRPDVVFHAAGHKHVPILERHAVEAVRTNLLATRALAQLAADHGCRFVHISTDKAVDPRSVMGASKRAAELAVLELGTRHQLPFATVRFGNVLGSRGSVVPTFLQQIVDGGPVTVTDPAMTRYFMTIPEAVSLVLQAGAMADEGSIFLLDMGDPVAIISLARQMIRLAGLRPDEDVEIRIVGARPGERLHERLHDDTEVLLPTRHPSISSVESGVHADRRSIDFFVELLLRQCAEACDPAAASLLEQLLRHCGVDCRLDVNRSATRQPLAETSALAVPAAGDTIALEPVANRAIRSTTPALLGGTPMFSPSLPFARPTRPPLGEVAARLEASYDRGILTNGPLVRELEERIADRLGVAAVVAVSSCTTGLMLALQAVLRDRSGTVIAPSFTFSASAHAVAWNGREPCFVECRADTFQIDVTHMAAQLDGAAAVLATHIFGAPCDPVAVAAAAQSRDVPVVFDAAHALGGRAAGVPIGRFGVAEVFSLTPTKVLVAGEGGLIATNELGLAETLRIGREYGNTGDYDTLFAGLNGRMSEFHAAMALASLDLIDEALHRRAEIVAIYRTHLEAVGGIGFQAVPPLDVSTNKDFTVTVAASEFGLTRDELAQVLSAEGIDTRCYFSPPVHHHRAYAHLAPSRLPVTDALAAAVLSLPIATTMDDLDVERVCEAILIAHHRAEELAARLAAGDVRLPRRGASTPDVDLRHTVA
jgi:FlaA1/EpsC-like NDP-sugar epimerase/dTDP-4-amino-4,6-dideoxygalactose transaminase